jgi:hypothetical protein
MELASQSLFYAPPTHHAYQSVREPHPRPVLEAGRDFGHRRTGSDPLARNGPARCCLVCGQRARHPLWHVVVGGTYQCMGTRCIQGFSGLIRFGLADCTPDLALGGVALASCGFFFSSLMLVLARRRKALLWGGTVSGLVIGFARMSDMAHWFSDVLWAYPITLMSSWLVWQLLRRAYGVPSEDRKPLATSG